MIQRENPDALSSPGFLFCSHDCLLLPNGEDILVFGGTMFSTMYNVRTGRSLYGIDCILSRDHGRAIALGRRVLVLGGDSLTNRVEEFLPDLQVRRIIRHGQMTDGHVMPVFSQFQK